MRSRITTALVLLLVAMVALQWRPLRLPCIERAHAPAIPCSAPNATALLVVDDGVVVASAAVGDGVPGDCSYAWWSALEEEFGATAFLSPHDIRDEGIPATALVAVRSASAAADRSSLVDLLAWVEAGHLLILDAVDERAAAALSIELSLRPMDSTGIQLQAVSVSLDSLRLAAPAFSLHSLPPRAQRLLGSGDRTLVATWPVGAGAIVVCGLDVARTVHTLRQSPPANDAPPTRWLPRADLLLRQVLHGAQALLPLPRIAALPAGADGLYLLSYDEQGQGDGAAALGGSSAQHRVASTIFVSAESMSKPGLRQLVLQGAEPQLQWNAAPHRPRRFFALGPFRPLWQERSLAAQRALLRERIDDDSRPLACARSEELADDSGNTRGYRILEANGFQLDSSLGPRQGEFGWVRETARPFHPLDQGGRPFQLLELPFAFRSDQRYHPHGEERLLRESQANYRAVLVASFRARAMRDAPAPHRMRGALDAIERAASYSHPVWSMGQYLEFRAARLASRVQRLRGRWHILASADNLALEIPVAAALDSVLLDGRRIALPAPHASGWQRIPLSAGEHVMEWSGEP